MGASRGEKRTRGEEERIEEECVCVCADHGEPKMFYFNMLHFGSHCFGYIVLEYSGEQCVFKKQYPFWVRKVNVALESLRRVYAVNDLYEAAQRKAVMT